MNFFEHILDKHWANQELFYDYRAAINTGNCKA